MGGVDLATQRAGIGKQQHGVVMEEAAVKLFYLFRV